jgi:TonB family protein
VFQVLTESTHRSGVALHRYALSVVMHGAVTATAVLLTRHPPADHLPRPTHTISLPALPRPSRSPAADPSQSSGGIVPAPSIEAPAVEAPDLELSRLPVRLPAVADLLEAHGRGGVPGPAGPAVELLTADAVDDPVAIVSQPLPRYPAALAAGGIAGRVVLEYVVDTAGRAEPASIRVLQSSHPAFAAAARSSVLGSRYRPARLRGNPVRQLVRQALSFRPVSRPG